MAPAVDPGVRSHRIGAALKSTHSYLSGVTSQPVLSPTMSASTNKLTPPLQSRHWTIALVLVQAVVCIFILQSRFWDSGSISRSCAPALVEAAAAETTTPAPRPSAAPKDVLKMPLLVAETPTASFRGASHRSRPGC
jgi:hypothetical protein